jgi:hypothetical protein
MVRTGQTAVNVACGGALAPHRLPGDDEVSFEARGGSGHE